MSSSIDLTFFALSDPTRRAILRQLMRGKATVGELAGLHPISMQAVSKHLRVLERARLVRKAKSGRERLIELHAAPLREAASWLNAYRQFWEKRLDALEGMLGEIEAKPQEGTENG